MNQAQPLWSPQLIQRYDLTGPRYTSYPTAVEFQALGQGDTLLDIAAASSDPTKPLSLYVHIPFCAHVCYYCACNKVITRNRAKAAPYLERLYQEIAYYAKRFGQGRVVEQLHWGGGTPTFLSHEEIRQLMAVIKQHFQLREDDQGDYGIEIDPREASVETLQLLREIGFNRISLGIQDIDPQVQEAVNRVQPIELVKELLDEARRLGFRSINFDLIYGLPKQSLSGFINTLETILTLSPDRLSVFNYAHLPDRFRPQRHIQAADLPNPATKLAILEHCITRLNQAGYQYIGMDHFAKPEDELAIAQRQGKLHRNFQGYTTHGNCELLAFGASAIAQIGDTYLQNQHDVGAWMREVAEQGYALKRGLALSQDDKIRRAAINQLICHFALDYASFNRCWGVDFEQYFSRELAALQSRAEDGLLLLQQGGLEILPQGRLLIRNICMEFDRYRQQGAAGTFSRII